MQDARIKEIQDRVDKATAGPWIYLFGDNYVYTKLEDGCRGMAISRVDYGNQQDNAKFIAHARQDLPFLLAALQEAQAENKKLCYTLDIAGEENCTLSNVISSKEDKIAELEEELQMAETRERVLREALLEIVNQPIIDKVDERQDNFKTINKMGCIAHMALIQEGQA